MATKANNSIFDDLAQSGAEILSDAKSLEFYAHDIYARGSDLTAVVRPRNTGQLAAAVSIAAAMGLQVIPRGGGMSYTGGYISDIAGAVVFDLNAMNRILNVNQADMTVTVEAGCTWAKLYATLKPLGLRTPFWGTLSGLKATVGGGMSQNCLFWGSGRYGTGVQSCVALEVVLADGSIIKTGSDFARPYGPDLTGLFLADTGAMGMKATITLRLIPEAKAHGFASFTFETHGAMLGAIAHIERAGIATECFGFDPKLNSIRMKRDSLSGDAKALVGMMKAQLKAQGSVLKALKEGVKVVVAGRDFMSDAQFSLHILAEGRIQAAADADISEARKIVARYGGAETENTIPKIIRANPFGPLNSILGPQGERWAPIHGLLPHSRAQACYDAIEALFDARRDEMAANGIHRGTLIAAVGGAGVLIEPCLYWPDVRNPLIEATVEKAHLDKLPVGAASPDGREAVHSIKQALVDLFFEYGAAHLQIGRAYRYADSLDPAASALLGAVKAHLDPSSRMNNGVLGIL